jgi:two-component system OmpR family sensor kinase
MRGLFGRIYLHFVGVLLVVAVAASLVFAFTARSAFVQESAWRTSRHVGRLVSEVFRDPSALARRVKQLHDELEVDVVVRDLDGRVLAAAGAEPPGFDADELGQARAGRRVVRPTPAWSAAGPVREPGTGVVIGTIESAARQRPVWAALARPALILSLVLVLLGIAAALLARRISRPAERLTEVVRRLGAGDLAARVPVDERKAADELTQLTQAFNDMAGRIERLVAGQKELMANVSHELRSPLTRVRVALELLPRDSGAEARLKDVEADLDELDRLIEDVLTTTRLEVTGIPPRPVRIDAREVLRDVATRAGSDPRLAAGGVLVAAGPAIELTADRALLRRALWNLVDNAVKYGAPPITLEAERQGNHVALSVTDQGEGIAPTERERVLAPFFRIDKARTHGETSGGFGLGLTLASRVAQVHHGIITIGPAETVAGTERGCRVTLTLPGAPAGAPSGQGRG